ncbi:MAG: hypothetical protein KDA55_14905, partial [Planctomycetales bacterium]|nr:hypothetical protein [Planctomycetales bacterium]
MSPRYLPSFQKLNRKSNSTRRNRKRHERRRAIFVESLEDRRMLATIVWDGGGADANWTTPENWSSDVAPITGDDLIFPVGGLQKTNINDFPPSTNFGSMLFVGDSYVVDGNELLLTGSITNNGTNNDFGIPVQLGSAGGFSSTSGTF